MFCRSVSQSGPDSFSPLRIAVGRSLFELKGAVKRRLRIFMAAIPLCLLLNKLHLFSLTQHRFILIQIVTFAYVLHVIKH